VRRSAGCLRRTRSCAERTRSSSPLRCFCQGARPRPNEVRAYIEEHRERFGIEPICRTLGVSASACYQRAVGERSARAIEDERLLEVIRATHRRNYEAYGYRRMWKALVRAGERVARCRVLRLMAGAWDPGREAARAAVADHQQRPGRARAGGSGRSGLHRRAAERLAGVRFHVLRCWEGVLYLAFVIDAFSRMVVGWQLAANMRTPLVLDALRMALGLRAPGADVEPVQRCDAGQSVHRRRLHPGPRRSSRTRVDRHVGDALDNASRNRSWMPTRPS